MNARHDNIEHTSLRYGLYTMGGLILYFLSMRLIGLHQIVELRAFNLIIMVFGVVYAINNFRKNHSGPFTYFKGIGLGTLTVSISVLGFALFLFIYLSFIDTAFLTYIKTNEPFGEYLNPFVIAAVIILEGCISGYFVAFTTMQYLKTAHFNEPAHK